jgi:phosphate transport system substrate-binding protein
MPWACRLVVFTFGLCFATTMYGQAGEKIIADGSTGMRSLVATLTKVYQERHPEVTVEVGTGMKTTARLQALADGKIDLAMASHGVNVEELTTQGLVVHKIAKMAVVFGVNATVSVTHLTDQQICAIYAGTVTNWHELGGPDVAIAPRTRPDQEVDTEVVRAHIRCLRDLPMAGIVKVMPTSGQMAKALANTAGAFGMTTMVRVKQSEGKIRPVFLNGIKPSAENMQRGTYPLTRDAFLVTTASPSPAVAQFLAFIRGPEAEAVMVANSAVPAK